MSQDNAVRLKCSNCGQANYWTHKNTRKLADIKLENKKFCKRCVAHTKHAEMKKKSK